MNYIFFSENKTVNRFLNTLLFKIKKNFFQNPDVFPELIKTVVDEIEKFVEDNFKLVNELVKIGIALSSEKNHIALLELILTKAMEFSNADGGTIYTVSENGKLLEFKILVNNSLNIRFGGTVNNAPPFPPLKLYDENMERNESQVAAFVALTGLTINIKDVYEVAGFDFKGTREFDKNTGYRSQSMLVVALKNHKDKIIGVLQLLNALDEKGEIIPFSKDVQKIIESLASQAAVAITNNMLIQDLQTLLNSIIRTIAVAIDEKTPHTAGHIQRVAILTKLIAEKINEDTSSKWNNVYFTEDEMTELNFAAWLHDVGKITTPDTVLEKKNKLDMFMDRIEVINCKFEILKREIELEYLKNKLALMNKQNIQTGTVRPEEYQSKINEIEEMQQFINKINVPTEFLTDNDLNKLSAISKLYYKNGDSTQPLVTEKEYEALKVRKGNLTDKERKIIENHVKASIKILNAVNWPEYLKNVPDIAGAHHKKLDGGGYPEDIEYKELSLQARILAVADVFEALSAPDRPYKKPKKLSECVKILGFMVKDKHLDKDIIDIFINSGAILEYAKKYLLKSQIDNFSYEGKEFFVPV